MNSQFQVKKLSHIDNYKLGSQLGHGGFAEVRSAIHVATEVQVAIKIYRKQKVRQKKLSQSVRRQINILKKLRHPNIIRLYDVFDTYSDIFLVLELVPLELMSFIEKGPIKETHALDIFKQILTGIHHCHSNGIAHRDLKPANILVDKNGCVKIADFGLSQKMLDGIYMYTHCGSINFMAPQILEQVPYEGTGIDVWSLGVILFNMVAGYGPFQQAQTDKKAMHKIKRGQYQIPDQFSAPLVDLIQKMLTVNPLKRIKTKDIFRHPWVNPNPIFHYLALPLQIQTSKSFIDQKTIELMLSMKVNFNGLKKQKIKKAIKKREDNYSFLIIYDLLTDNLLKNTTHPPSIPKVRNQSLIFGQNSSKMPIPLPTPSVQKGEWIFGKLIRQSAQTIAQNFIKNFQKLGIEILQKSEQYKMKCTYKQGLLEQADPIQEIDSQKRIEEDQEENKFPDIQQFSTRAVAFYLQILRCPNKVDHIVDLLLIRGSPILFLQISDRVFNLLDNF